MVIVIDELRYYSIFLILTIILTTLVVRSLSKKTSGRRHLRLPPSPPSLPIIGHIHLVRTPFHLSFHNISTKHGPILTLKFGASEKILISSASIAIDIFKKHDVAFAARPPFAYEVKLPHVASSFVNAPYGEYWRSMKKLCVTKLLGPQALGAAHGVRREELFNLLRKIIRSASSEKTIDVGFEVSKLANNTICRMVMSTRCSSEDNEAEICRRLVDETFEYAVKLSIGEVLGPFKWLGFWLFGNQAVDVGRRFDDLTEKIWKEHEERRNGGSRFSGESKDLMDILLDVYNDDNAEYKFTRTQIKTFVQELFFAGTDTSSNATIWTLAELINRPDVFKKVREEIESVVGNSSRLVEESDIPSLTYLEAVIHEVLRLNPVGSIISRQCREHCKINGFDIPAKASVIINTYSIMRDPNMWDDPDEFKPERFFETNLDKEAENGKRFSNFLAFGGGRRKCPGEMLAYRSVSSTVAAMVQCFDWKPYHENGKEAKTVDMEVAKTLTHQMARPLICLPIVRFNPFLTQCQ